MFRAQGFRQTRPSPAPRAGRSLQICALLAVGLACQRGAAPGERQRAAISVEDDAGHPVVLPRPARRVVSLVPSATDVLVALEVADRIVARTDYDIAPEVADRPSVGGGLDPSLETLVAAEPDLVIAWAEAGPTALRDQLDPLGIQVFGLRSQDTADVFGAIRNLSHLVARDAAGAALTARIRRDLRAIRASTAGRPLPSVVYLVEVDPPLIAGPATFVAEIIGVAGGRTAFPDVTGLWPQISLEALVQRQPDVLVLPRLASLTPFIQRMSDEPGWRDLRAVRRGRVVQIPPELLSRPGPQIVAAARALRDRLHPPEAGEAR